MAKTENGIYQMENGLWAYRFSIVIDGKRISRKKTTDADGNKLKAKREATKAREAAIANAHIEQKRKQPIARRTVKEVFEEYCEKGRAAKAYNTCLKQDSLWKNHLCERFGKRFVDDILQSFLKFTHNRFFHHPNEYMPASHLYVFLLKSNHNQYHKTDNLNLHHTIYIHHPGYKATLPQVLLVYDLLR